MTNRNSDDLLNPHRVFYRLIKDYNDGKLTDKSLFHRAVVTLVDNSSEGGTLETTPPNPPNSIKARIYSKALDANLPEAALSIFYPFFPAGVSHPISPGDHVFVFFEDKNYSNGFWVTQIPNYTLDLNDFNPNNKSGSTRSSADSFEGTTTPAVPVPADEYQVSGNSNETNRRNQQLQQIVETTTSKFLNKKILNIGDSHTAGAYGNVLGQKISQMGGTYIRDGRSSWSVENWVAGVFTGRAQTEHRNGPTLDQLIAQFSPDIVIVSLGANDWFRGRVAGFQSAANTLWQIARTAPKCIWVGPPETVGRASNQQSGLERVNSTLVNVVGVSNFVRSTDVTNITEERDALGIHFLQNPHAYQLIQPWIDRIINIL